MIKVTLNPNFRSWWNVTLHGKLVDNARTKARALRIADALSRKTSVPVNTNS